HLRAEGVLDPADHLLRGLVVQLFDVDLFGDVIDLAAVQGPLHAGALDTVVLGQQDEGQGVSGLGDLGREQGTDGHDGLLHGSSVGGVGATELMGSRAAISAMRASASSIVSTTRTSMPRLRRAVCRTCCRRRTDCPGAFVSTNTMCPPRMRMRSGMPDVVGANFQHRPPAALARVTSRFSTGPSRRPIQAFFKGALRQLASKCSTTERA